MSDDDKVKSKLIKKAQRVLDYDRALITPTPGLPNTPQIKTNVTPKISFNKPFSSQIKSLVKESDYVINIEKQLNKISFSTEVTEDKFFHIIKLQLLLLYKAEHVEVIIDFWLDRTNKDLQGLYKHLWLLIGAESYILLLRCLEKSGNVLALSFYLDEVADKFYYQNASINIVADYLPVSFKSKKDPTAILRAIAIYVGYKHLKEDGILT